MILSYTEASAYATSIAEYLILVAMSSIIFTWAWQNITEYFESFFEPSTTLDDVVDALRDVQTQIELLDDEPRQLEIVA